MKVANWVSLLRMCLVLSVLHGCAGSDGFKRGQCQGTAEQRPCFDMCGQQGVEICENGQWTCDLFNREERCHDLVDNDCDGSTDEGCACRASLEKPCGLVTGACQSGLQVCRDGLWTECQGQIGPQVEKCDGRDNDCDGEVDEDLNCNRV